MKKPTRLACLCLIAASLTAADSIDLRQGDLKEVNDHLRQLRQTGDAAALQTLLTALENPHPEVVARAIDAVPDFGPQGITAAEHLLRAADREDPRVKRAAIKALGELKDDRASELLVRAMAHPDELIRKTARASLCAIADIDHGPQAATWQSWRENWLRRREQDLLPRAERLLAAESQDPLGDLRQLVAATGHRHLIAETLHALLQHPNPQVAQIALAQLRNRDDAISRYLTAQAIEAGVAQELARRSELWKPAPPPTSSVSVSSAPVATLSPAPPEADASVSEDLIFFLIFGSICLLVIAIPAATVIRKSHQQIGERTRRIRRNQSRIEINF